MGQPKASSFSEDDLAARRVAGKRAVFREPAAFPAAHVDGLGTFGCAVRSILLMYAQLPPATTCRWPWTDCTVRFVA